MTPQLDLLIVELGAVRARAHRLADDVDERTWRQRPPGSGWAMAECLIHLNITAREMLPRLRAAIASGRRDGVTGEGPFRPGVVGGLLRWFLEPPYRVRTTTAASFNPASAQPKAEVMAEFDARHDAVITCIHDADGLDLSRLKIISPFDARVRYNLYAAFRIIAAHDRRHVWQAERAKAHAASTMD